MLIKRAFINSEFLISLHYSLVPLIVLFLCILEVTFHFPEVLCKVCFKSFITFLCSADDGLQVHVM